MPESPSPTESPTPSEPPRKLPPTGSEVRDHLANERTYLAWLRTGVALLGLGFVVARLRVELSGVVPLEPRAGWANAASVGLGFAVLGVVTVLFATWRYFAVRRMIDEQRFVALGSGVLVLSTGALAVAIMVVLYLLHQLFP